jgi:hypothetical protein
MAHYWLFTLEDMGVSMKNRNQGMLVTACLEGWGMCPLMQNTAEQQKSCNMIVHDIIPAKVSTEVLVLMMMKIATP